MLLAVWWIVRPTARAAYLELMNPIASKGAGQESDSFLDDDDGSAGQPAAGAPRTERNRILDLFQN